MTVLHVLKCLFIAICISSIGIWDKACAEFEPSYYVKQPSSELTNSISGSIDQHAKLLALANALEKSTRGMQTGHIVVLRLDPQTVSQTLDSKQLSLASIRDILSHAEPGSPEHQRALGLVMTLLTTSFENSQQIHEDAVRISLQTENVGKGGYIFVSALTVLFFIGGLIRFCTTKHQVQHRTQSQTSKEKTRDDSELRAHSVELDKHQTLSQTSSSK